MTAACGSALPCTLLAAGVTASGEVEDTLRFPTSICAHHMNSVLYHPLNTSSSAIAGGWECMQPGTCPSSAESCEAGVEEVYTGPCVAAGVGNLGGRALLVPVACCAVLSTTICCWLGRPGAVAEASAALDIVNRGVVWAVQTRPRSSTVIRLFLEGTPTTLADGMLRIC